MTSRTEYAAVTSHWLWVLVLVMVSPALGAGDANRLTYLDEPLDPYYVHRDFPKLTTPQWVGEEGVDAVVVLAIDDMRDTGRYEQFLRPILERLKKIDGRAAASIMANHVDPADPQLARWLDEGLSIEVHTLDHPCPCLQGGSLTNARQTYEQCVDLMAQIPGNRPVAFRMPCCDSLNTPSPRFWAEIFNGTTASGNFLTIDSSVFQIFTSADPQLPRELVQRPDGAERFRYYVPFPSFVNTIENYPYPYLIGRKCWQFPCAVPSDWEAQHIQQPNNPETVRDMQRALDATVIKKGVFNLVFHPHNWIRNDQIVAIVDYAVEKHGRRVKFLSFRECDERLQSFLLGGQPLRTEHGGDNGVRLLDLNHDGFIDVLIGNDDVQQTRIWSPEEGKWLVSPLPARIVETARVATDQQRDQNEPVTAARFAIAPDGQVLMLVRSRQQSGAWQFDGRTWQAADQWLRGLEVAGQPLRVASDGRDEGLRLRDVNGDGRVECLISNSRNQAVLQWRDDHWEPAPFGLPEQVRIVDDQGRDAGLRFVDADEDGFDDLLFSDEVQYGLYLAREDQQQQFAGWPAVAVQGLRSAGDALPMISRQGTNNGAWLHSGHLWVQNEDTNRLPDHVDRRLLVDLLGDFAAMPPPRSPQRSLDAMHVAPGMQVELVASEPLVMDPIAFDWGPDGRLWVVEMGDYPMGTGPEGRDGGRIKTLKDTDGDGKYDHAELFLDQVGFPTGIKVWRQGVLITAAPEIFYAADTDGDGKADQRQTLYQGFVEGNQQHRVNGLRWGLDNWLHVANGDSGGIVESAKTGQRVAIGGRDLRIRPDEGLLEAESGQTQFGRDRDDWNHWFGGNNSNPIWHYVLSDHDLRRNPHWVPPDARRQVSVTPGAAPVFPASRPLPRFNDFNMVNRFTSACGLTIYRDRLLGDEFTGNAFICEPVHNLVHRHVLIREGISFRGQRAAEEQQSEFLASEDHWFRPTMARTGPDGALWIADMYRLVIEHPEWIPADWQQRLNLRAGEDRGRIYRIYPQQTPPRPLPRLDRLDTPQLVAQLASDNGWLRDMAQQLLIHQANPQAPPLLAEMVRSSLRPLARLHALCTLDGLNALDTGLLRTALEDEHPGVRQHAVRLAGPRLASDTALAERLVAFSSDPDINVQLQLLLALGEWPSEQAAAPMLDIVRRHADEPYIVAAFISSLRKENIAGILAGEKSVNGLTADALAQRVNYLSPAVQFAVATGQTEALRGLIRNLLDTGAGDRAATRFRLTMLAELLESVPESEAQRRALYEALQDELPAISQLAQTILQSLSVRADGGSGADRPTSEAGEGELAVRVLAGCFWDHQGALEQLRSLLDPSYPPEVQQAAARGLSQFSDPQIAGYLLENWRSHTPALRTQILDVLTSRTTWTRSLLDSIETGTIPAAHVDAARRSVLLNHRAPAIRDAAARILSEVINADRQKVVQQYDAATRMVGDLDRGRAVFKKTCSACHRLEGVGNAVGPDLNALSDKSPAALLVAIFDPNRAVEDKYLEYLAVTFDGRQHQGMIANESSNGLTLILQEGKQLDLLRSDIEQLVTTGRSMMPEGLERDLPLEDAAHLLAYLRSSQPPAKTFPGNKPELAHVRDDGSVRMLATNCRIYGPSVVFEDQYRNLGYWSSPEDRAEWDIRVPKTGEYRIVLDYACSDDVAGNRFVIQVAGQTIAGQTVATGDWNMYRSQDVGTINLEAGEYELVFRSDGPINGFLLDLRGIVLDPK